MSQRPKLLASSLMYVGAIDFNQDIDSTVLPAHLANCLRNVHAGSVKTEANRVAFSGGAFRLVTNWNVLVPFGFGELTVDSSTLEIRYRLSFRQLAISVSIAAGLMAAFFLFKALVAQFFTFVPIMWIWLVGFNLVIGVPRFETFIRKAIATAPRHKTMTI
jgi:hypothetical protein